MRYCYQIFVRNTAHFRYEAPRAEPYASAGGPITAAEKTAALAAMPALVASMRDIMNSALPPQARPAEFAYVEVHPLYDAADAVLDTLQNMSDEDVLSLPDDLQLQPPDVPIATRNAFHTRLAAVALVEATAAASDVLTRRKTRLPAGAQTQIPAQVNLTVDS